MNQLKCLSAYLEEQSAIWLPCASTQYTRIGERFIGKHKCYLVYFFKEFMKPPQNVETEAILGFDGLLYTNVCWETVLPLKRTQFPMIVAT